jgi:hypothetical protein
MFEWLDRYGLRKKYAVIGFFGGIIGVFISYYLLGRTLDLIDIVLIPFAVAIGAYVGQ